MLLRTLQRFLESLRSLDRSSRSVHLTMDVHLHNKARFHLLLLQRRPMPVMPPHTSVPTHLRRPVTLRGLEPTHQLVTVSWNPTSRISLEMISPHSHMIVHVRILMSMLMCSRMSKSDIGEPEISTYRVPSFGIMYFCGAFWQAPNTGTDSKVCSEFEMFSSQIYLSWWHPGWNNRSWIISLPQKWRNTRLRIWSIWRQGTRSQ